MDRHTLVRVLNHLRPGAEWAITGSEITWLDQTQAQPTDAELLAGKAVLDSLAYRDLRSAAYPSIGDQLDALWKGGADAAAMKAKIQEVKDRFPKP